MYFGIFSGKLDEYSKGKVFKDDSMRHFYEDRIIKYEIKVNNFDQ